MSRETSSWYSDRVGQEVHFIRWGEIGTPVLFFPTAAADYEEVERFLMVDALAPLLEAGRIKLYSVDSIAGHSWLTHDNSFAGGAAIQNGFDEFIYRELVPAIRTDCHDDEIEIVVTGPSIGAFNALAAICRHPDVFRAAICMSGTYDVSRFLEGHETPEYHACSPLHFIPHLPDGEHLDRLRERFVLLTHGQGRWEDPEESWRTADVLGARGIPNRVSAWDPEWDHDWVTWREMLPMYLDELL